jgi:hypothetical protein
MGIPQTITFSVSSPQTVGSLSVSASSTNSTLDVTITIVSGPATIGGSSSGSLTNSGTVTLTGPGIVVLAANQAGNESFDPATEVRQTFNVAPAGRYFYATMTGGSTPTTTKFTFASTLFKIHSVGDLNINPYLNYVATNLSQITAYCPSTGQSVSFSFSVYNSLQNSPYLGPGNIWVLPVNITSIPFAFGDVVQFYAANQPSDSVLFPPNQVITWNPTLNQLVGTTHSLNGTSSSALTVSYTSSDTNIATITGTTATFHAAGTVIITASQAGNDVIYAAPEVQKTFVVKLSQTITWIPTLNQVAGTPYTVDATAPGGTVTYASSKTSVATISGTTVTFHTNGTVNITASQAGNGTYAAAPTVLKTFVVKLPQTITWNPTLNQVVGTPYTVNASSPVGTVTYASSNTSIATISGTTASFAAPGIVTITASQAGNGTYAATQITASFNVAPAGRYFYAVMGIGFNHLPGYFSFIPSNFIRINPNGDLNVDPYLNYVAANLSQITAYCPSTGASVSFSIKGSPYITGVDYWTIPTVLSSVPFSVDDVVHFYAANQPPNSVLFPPNQVISWNPSLSHIAGTTYALNGTSSSNLAVSYTSSNSIADISGTTVTFGSAGTVNITASQAGNGTYDPAADVPYTFTVDAAPLVINDAFTSMNEYNTVNPLSGIYVIAGIVNQKNPDTSLTSLGPLREQSNLNVLGTYDNLAALNAAHGSDASVGDLYIAGGHYYVSSSLNAGNGFSDQGPVVAPSGVPCFVPGTRILTPEGYKAVETLRQGSLVTTADGRIVPAKLYRTHLKTTTSISAPYTIPAGSFGLKTELTVSPMHAFQMRKGLWMIPAAAAKLDAAVVQKTLGEPATYYHIECPQYFRDNLVVDGIVVESYSAKQIKACPYTWSASLKGFTRVGSIVGTKITVPQ